MEPGERRLWSISPLLLASRLAICSPMTKVLTELEADYTYPTNATGKNGNGISSYWVKVQPCIEFSKNH